MITNKDIRVENGSLIINGDPYPLDGQSPEAIMQIVEDNSDTTPTENSDAPITSGGVYTAIAGKITFTDVTVNKDTTGYAAPVRSAGGVYYESLITYAALGITKDKILSVILVDWNETAKSFNYYLGGNGIGVLTDSNTSVYKDTLSTDLTLRVVHLN